MNFIKNSVSTISNAVEINKLKDKRSELNKEKKELEQACAKYDDQVNMKENIGKITHTNKEIITSLRNMFAKNNIKYDIEFSEFISTYDNQDYRMYKILYDQLVLTNSIVEDSVKHLDKNVCIDRQIYVDRIGSLDEKIEKINSKLEDVRDKQFGKKN